MRILILKAKENAVRLFRTICSSLSISKEYKKGTDYSIIVCCVEFPYEVVDFVRAWKMEGLKTPFIFFTEYKNLKLLKVIYPRFTFVTDYTSSDELWEVCHQSLKKEPNLTMREREVLYGCMNGKSANESCQELNISPNTYYMHKKKLLRKLGLSSTQQLIVYGMLEQMVRIPHS